jgi:hypothetical protein
VNLISAMKKGSTKRKSKKISPQLKADSRAVKNVRFCIIQFQWVKQPLLLFTLYMFSVRSFVVEKTIFVCISVPGKSPFVWVLSRVHFPYWKLFFLSTFVGGLKFMNFLCLQDRILVMHETSLICPLLKITPKAKVIPDDDGSDVKPKDETKSSGGLALGKNENLFK